MKEIPVSEEMKEKIAPFFNEKTGRYDIEAVREAQRQSQPRRRYADLFAGFSDGDGQDVEHTMVSAAVRLNAELDAQDEEVQDTNNFVQDIVAFETTSPLKFADSIKSRFHRFTEENQRHAIAELLNIHEATRDAKFMSPEETLGNRLAFILDELGFSDSLPGDEHVQSLGYSLKKAYDFVNNQDNTEFFTRLPEEYLASLGL